MKVCTIETCDKIFGGVDDRFCTEHGAALVDVKCTCGNPSVAAHYQFCSRCGQRLDYPALATVARQQFGANKSQPAGVSLG